MPLDPQCQMVLDAVEAMGMPPLETMNPTEIREALGGFGMLMGEGDEVADVSQRTVPGPGGEVPVIVCTPEGTGPLPVFIYYHGGGYVGGTAELVEPVCRTVANQAGCVVVDVDYRLAPEHRYPAAVEDSYAVLEWVAGHAAEIGGDPARIALGGDSAGGGLTAAVSQMARDQHGPAIALQVLLYPAVDSPAADYPSRKENAEGYLLHTAAMEMFYGHYLPADVKPDDPYAFPIRAASLAGLPPAFVATCEYDPLRDEGEAYAQRLTADGVATDARRYDGQIHGVFWLGATVDAGRTLMDDVVAALKKAFAT
ncbi:MAG: alpha/beta hydrolase [Acidimicrobiia bacterium]